MAMREETVEYRDGEAELCGLLVSDDRGGKRPGVLVVHGGAGLDDHARGRARQLAQLGVVVLACDMYGQAVAGDRDRIVSCVLELRDDPGKMCQRAWAGVQALASHPRVNGQIAAVGYCFGGRAVLELARSGADLAGAISVHGSLETARPAAPGDVKAKVLVCHGALDPHVRAAQLAGFIDEMNRAGADWQLTVYGGAMHGFTHDVGPRLRVSPTTPLPTSGASPRSRRSWPRSSTGARGQRSISRLLALDQPSRSGWMRIEPERAGASWRYSSHDRPDPHQPTEPPSRPQPRSRSLDPPSPADRATTREGFGTHMGVIAAMIGVLAHGVPASASAMPRIRNSTAAASSRVVIRWTAHHIPHIEARTLYGIGYGEGYVQATDNLCTLADRFLTEAARRSRFFGPDATYRDQAEAPSVYRNLDSDFFYQRIKDQRTIEHLLSDPAPVGPTRQARSLAAGFAAGYDRYLGHIGVSRLPDPTCRGAAWVRPITALDVWRHLYATQLLASSRALLPEIVAAQPPAPAPSSHATAPAAGGPRGAATRHRVQLRSWSAGEEPGTTAGCRWPTPTFPGTGPSASTRPS